MSATAAERHSTETRKQGLAIAPGLGLGRAQLVRDVLKCAEDHGHIQRHEVGKELSRIAAAVDNACQDLETSARRVEQQFSSELADIFRAHKLMLKSLFSSREFEQEIQESLINAESAVKRLFNRWQERFQSLQDENFQQKADDIADVGRKVLSHLEGEYIPGLKDLAPGTVLVMERLLPSDVVALSRRKIAGVVVECLGRGCHAALLAREKRIPTVAGLAGILELLADGDEVLVDGDNAEVILWPSAETQSEFRRRMKEQERSMSLYLSVSLEPVQTRDGMAVKVEGNIGTLEDAEFAMKNGADGIGLFRIEQLYLERTIPPTETELLEELRAVVSILGGKPLTVRLLDIGGDKMVPFLRLPGEGNPLLGKRGVRLLLEYPQLVRTQLLALVPLAQEQELRVLVPMVTLEEDILRIKELLASVTQELGVSRPPPLGAMIETPAAALCASDLARHVDFLSLGTNDLTQYTLAVGRDDASVTHYYQDDHSSILRLLDIVLAEARGKPITICGELAGREEMLPELLSKGFRSFSVAPPLIPKIKKRIQELNSYAPQQILLNLGGACQNLRPMAS